MSVVRSCVLPGARHRELAGDAYACESCQCGLVRKLGEIEDYLVIVSPVPSRSGDFGPRRPGYSSRPPLRLDVVAMLDARTEINGASGVVNPDGIDDDVLDEIPNLGADIGGWLRVLYEEHPDWQYRQASIGQNMQISAAGVAQLRSYIGWIVCQPWVDEFASDVSRVHVALRQACKDFPPKPAGYCLDAACGGPVFRRSDDPRDPRMQCSSCSTTYDGLDLVRIRSAS